MSTHLIHRVSGDLAPFVCVELVATNVTGWTIKLLGRYRENFQPIDIDHTVDDALLGQFHFEWGATDLIKGIADLEIDFLPPSGKRFTIPAENTLILKVRGKGEPGPGVLSGGGDQITIDQDGRILKIFGADGIGDVVGPSISIDSELVLFDGVTGRLIKGGSGWTVVAGNLIGAGLVDGRDLSADGGVLDAHVVDGSIHFTEGSIDHGSIGGLGDDDHTQYLLVNGSRGLTGNLVPSADLGADLGTTPLRFGALHVGPASLHVESTVGETTTARDWAFLIEQGAGATEGNLRLRETATEVLSIGVNGAVGVGKDPVAGVGASGLDALGIINSQVAYRLSNVEVLARSVGSFARVGSTSASEELRLRAGGSDRLTIATTGIVGIGTGAPTHTLTMPSTATGVALYNTADQVTDFERGRLSWESNVLTLQAEAGGVGVDRAIGFETAGARQVTITNVGNVGIGIIAPLSNIQLDVRSDARSSVGWGSASVQYGRLTWASGTAIVHAQGGLDLRLGAGGSTDDVTINTAGFMGIGTTAPTHSLTLASVETGVAIYNTSDQVTNFERGRLSWESNVLTLQTESGGSGTLRNLEIEAPVIVVDGDLDHDGTNVGFYGAAPAAQSAAYTRNAVIVEDRTLLASASATIINNNNVLAALIADLQAVGLLG